MVSSRKRLLAEKRDLGMSTTASLFYSEDTMKPAIILGDMLEIDGKSIHVGLIPCIVNNQVDLWFSFDYFLSTLAAGRSPKPQIS